MNTQSISRSATAAAFSFTVALLAPSGAAFAQTTDPAPARAQHMAGELQKRFAAADANGDGKLTKDEAKGKMPMVYKNFDEIDSSHSGTVSMADIAAYVKARKAASKPLT